MAYGLVYCVTNKLNGKKYVGQTTHDENWRWIHHVSAARTIDTLFYRAIRKHGREAFTVKVLEDAESRELLDSCEVKWIAVLGTMAPGGYNLSPGGIAGGRQSDETREKKRLSQLRRYEDPAERAKKSAAWKEVWRRPEVRADRSESLAAYWTAEKRMKQAEYMKDRKRDSFGSGGRAKAGARRKIPVVARSERFDFGAIYPSCGSAVKALGLTASAVSMCISGKRPTHKGYTFTHMEK